MTSREKETIEFVRRYLRKASLRWKPIYETRLKNRRSYEGPTKNRKYEYKCEDCDKYFPSGKVQVHHVEPVGSLKSIDDLAGFVTRLLCDGSGLVLLCKSCHRKY